MTATRDEILSIMVEAMTIRDAQMVQRDKPQEDKISRTQANKKYGYTWMQFHIDRGIIRGVRMGTGKNSKIVFSDLELAQVAAADRIAAQIAE